ncbi:hypothetical protein LCGC14_1837670, partial [marine sediment metagenome]
FDSTADTDRDKYLALEIETIDVTEAIPYLTAGQHVLAIQALNDDVGSSDLLIRPELIGHSGPGLVLDATTTVKARTWADGQWSALSEAVFYVDVAAAAGSLAITELNYNPVGPTDAETAVATDLGVTFNNEDFEFVELRNVGATTVDVAGVRFGTGITFEFATESMRPLAPGESVVLVANTDAFAARYGDQFDGVPIDVAGAYEGQLANGGEPIGLFDRFGEPIIEFRYNDAGGWPGRADGSGSSLEVLDSALYITAGDYDDPDNWRSSSEYGGSPGIEGAGPIYSIVVNEVLSHSGLNAVDAIELHNTTGTEINIGGWYLSDSNDNYRKFRIPDDTVLAPGTYRVFDESHFNPSGGVDPLLHPNDFALNGAHGDDVWLLAADTTGRLTHFIDHAEFPAAALGETFGRWPNGSGRFYPMQEDTIGNINTGPRIGPIIISEVHYNPVDPDPGDIVTAADLEFVEIYNPTNAAVDLTDWRLRGGIDFDFASGTMLESHTTLVIVPFDPSDATRLAVFHTAYSIDATVPLVGGHRDKLNNAGDRVQLQRPDVSPPDEPDYVPHLLEDEVIYDELAPWPTEPDGQGQSLHRLGIDLWGHDATSWTAAVPTPGTAELGVAGAEVVGRYVFYNNSRFDGFNAAAEMADDDAIATDKQALMPGQTATLANYTSYSRGINGIMIDVFGLDDPASLNALEDFRFKIGNDGNPADWPDAPAPLPIDVRPGAGVGGSDRVTIRFSDNAIEKQWLEVTMLATPNTRLADPDVFYFGSAPGETGNSTVNTIVNATDEIAARNFQHSAVDKALVDDRYDYNRDGLVDGTDQIIARNNQTNPLTMLRLITAPVQDAATKQATALEALEPLSPKISSADLD